MKRLRKAATRLSDELATLPEADRATLAAVILRLDDDQAAAHEAVGDVQFEGAWVPKDRPPLLKRRRDLQLAVQKARRLEIKLETGKSPYADFIRELTGNDGSFVRWENIEIHSGEISVTKLERILREALRSVAFSNYVRHGKLEVPKFTYPHRWIQPGSRKNYMRAIDLSEKAGKLSAKEAGYARQLAGYDDQRGFRVVDTNFEAILQAAILYDLWVRRCAPHRR